MGRADVRAHDLGRQKAQEAALDADACERVVAVTGPHAVGVAQDAGVGPRATRRAAFDLDPGVRFAHARQQAVQRQVVLPIGGAAVRVGTQRGGGQVAVHVPLQVGDGVLAQQRVELVEQVVRHLVARQVEHQLVAADDPRAARHLQCPARVGPVQIAVGVDHLRLDPQAELQAQAPHVGDQRRQPVWVFTSALISRIRFKYS